MKPIFLLILFIFNYTIILGQAISSPPFNVFDSIYVNHSNYLSNNQKIIIGNTNNFSPNNTILKLDSNDIPIWQYQINFTTTHHTTAKLNLKKTTLLYDNHLILGQASTNQLWIGLISPDGKILKSQLSYSNYIQSENILATKEEGFLIAGYINKTNQESLFIAKGDNTGNIQWTTTFPEISKHVSNKLIIEELPNQNIIIAGQSRLGFFILLTDKSGKVLNLYINDPKSCENDMPKEGHSRFLTQKITGLYTRDNGNFLIVIEAKTSYFCRPITDSYPKHHFIIQEFKANGEIINTHILSGLNFSFPIASQYLKESDQLILIGNNQIPRSDNGFGISPYHKLYWLAFINSDYIQSKDLLFYSNLNLNSININPYSSNLQLDIWGNLSKYLTINPKLITKSFYSSQISTQKHQYMNLSVFDSIPDYQAKNLIHIQSHPTPIFSSYPTDIKNISINSAFYDIPVNSTSIDHMKRGIKPTDIIDFSIKNDTIYEGQNVEFSSNMFPSNSWYVTKHDSLIVTLTDIGHGVYHCFDKQGTYKVQLEGKFPFNRYPTKYKSLTKKSFVVLPCKSKIITDCKCKK